MVMKVVNHQDLSCYPVTRGPGHKAACVVRTSAAPAPAPTDTLRGLVWALSHGLGEWGHKACGARRYGSLGCSSLTGLSISAINEDEHTIGEALLLGAAQTVEQVDCFLRREYTTSILRAKHFRHLEGFGMRGVKGFIIGH
jgi:hypothetical protein